MGGYLLDTHAALWFFNGDEDKLSAVARRIIGDDSCPIYLSVVSAWELAIRIGLDKLRFPGNAAGFICLAQAWDITMLPIETAHLTALESLPLIHRDHFDRLIVATALIGNMTLITADENIARYDVSQIW